MVQPGSGLVSVSVPRLLAITVLFVAALLVVTLLVSIDVEVTRRVVVALTPWMLVGGATRALDTVGAYPDQFSLLFGPIAVYPTTFIAAGMAWAMMDTAAEMADEGGVAQYLAATGVGATVATGAAAVAQGLGAELRLALWAVGALAAAAVVSGGAYLALSFVYSRAIIHTGLLGWIVVFGQGLDATTTAVAADVQSIPANSELNARILEVAAGLPVAPTVGTGWLLVLARVVLGAAVVVVVAAAIDSRTGESHAVEFLVLGVAAAVGLGPGMHHLLLLFV